MKLIIKYMVQMVLPVFCALYFALASIWGLSYKEEILGTISVIDTFLGALLYAGYFQYCHCGAKMEEAENDKID